MGYVHINYVHDVFFKKKVEELIFLIESRSAYLSIRPLRLTENNNSSAFFSLL